MNKHVYFISIILILCFMSGCVPISKLKLDKINSVRLLSASLSSSEIMLSVDVVNNSNKVLNINQMDIFSDDFENLSVFLKNPVALDKGKNTLNIPFCVKYSLGSAFALANILQNENDKQYSILFKVKYSTNQYGISRKCSFKKKFSKDELKSLITNFAK